MKSAVRPAEMRGPRRAAFCLLSPVLCLLLFGCGGNLPAVSAGATIVVWRVVPGRDIRTGTQLITADLRTDREAFFALYRNARRVGTCDALAFDGQAKATPFLILQFCEPGRPINELQLLKGEGSAPLDVGHGAIDLYAKGPTCPEYRYRLADVRALDEWLSRQPPPRPKPPESQPHWPLVWPLYPTPKSPA